METFLAGWGDRLSTPIALRSYDDLIAGRHPGRGVYIFTDHERLSPCELADYAMAADALLAAGCRVLNHPRRVLSRYALLKALHARGDNRFAVYRPTVSLEPERYPVFLRVERGHEIITPLIETPDHLIEAIAGLATRGYTLDDVLMVEFCNTADEHGIFRKYAAVVVDDRVVANGVCFSRDWIVKFVEISSDREQREVWEYMLNNPHQRYLTEVCALAGIEFGRIDYAVLHGTPQIWEINTNPVLLTSADWDVPISLARKQYFARNLHRALEELDQTTRLAT